MRQKQSKKIASDLKHIAVQRLLHGELGGQHVTRFSRIRAKVEGSQMYFEDPRNRFVKFAGLNPWERLRNLINFASLIS